MRKFPFLFIIAIVVATTLSSCFKDEVDNGGKYASWKKANETWLLEQLNLIDQNTGNNYYATITAPWDDNAKVYMHWYNDTMKTMDNLRPLYTSQVDVKYRGMLYDGTPFDSSYLRTSPAVGIYRFRMNGQVIEGWPIAISRMHVGDSCRVLIPYNVGYGEAGSGSTIKPYSLLQFDIKLEDINRYEH